MFQEKHQRAPLSPDFYDGYYKFKRNLETRGIGGNIRMRSDAILAEPRISDAVF